MQKLSFIKGLAIGTLFSAIFWFGAYQAFSNISNDDVSQDQNIETTDIKIVRASL